MKHGLIKVAAGAPAIRVADPIHNAAKLADAAKEAAEAGVRVLVFPELCVTGYTCGDLLYSQALLTGAREALTAYLAKTAELELLSVVGLPFADGDQIYNCAAVCYQGELLGLVPRTKLTSHGVLCQTRYFSAPRAEKQTVFLAGKEIPFGTDLLFGCQSMPALRIAVEIGEAPCMSETSATVICIPAASAETVGKREWRQSAIKSATSCRTAGILYASAGDGESTTDAAFGGYCAVGECGALLSERQAFDVSSGMAVSELDLERILHDRRRNGQGSVASALRTVSFSMPLTETTLTRRIDPSPFIPAEAERASRCETILDIQTTGLKQRVTRAYAQKLVLGISGGLDSTLALLVAVRAMDALGRSHKDILAVTMPCFGTTKRTKNNATVLCEELGVDFRCVNIFDAVNQHFKDIGHDPAIHNVTYENCQARERTQVLMDIANDCGGMVLGTGDLSELALGWATYNGDHMSMYGVNSSVPKTLVRYLVAHCAEVYEQAGNQKIADALRDVLNTPVSPELLPANEDGEIAQKTEDLVGPYELHDFYLYYMLRFGYSPSKLYRLSQAALGDRYEAATRKKWLQVFVRRFFNQQFKRSCSPDGPKVGTVSLSPRGDWCMPSDASAALWLAEIETL